MRTEVLVQEARHCEHYLAVGSDTPQQWNRVEVPQRLHLRLPVTPRTFLFSDTLGLDMTAQKECGCQGVSASSPVANTLLRSRRRPYYPKPA